MTLGWRRPATLATLALVVAACSTGGSDASTASQPATTSPTEAPSPSSAVPTAATPSGETSEPPSPAATTAPVIDAAWAKAELTNVATGEPFRIADLAGKAVILETMAIWCPNCLTQQVDVHHALEELDSKRVAYVVLDVDPNETGSALAEYRTSNGFTGTYAIAGREVARGLAEQFGDQVLNPPSTPVILIGTDGQVTLTEFGHKSPEEIVQLARDHGA
jgi:thiol-disulfide isomerase/thioredoxin